MSDWADFCESFGINPNDPDEFDKLLDSFDEEEPVLTHKTTGKVYSFRELANKYCGRCNGTGYIGRFKWNCNGRCFKCIPNWKWNQLTVQ